MKLDQCFSCGAFVETVEGPVHKYLASSPGCWATYGEILAREFNNATYWPGHRLTVDAYAVQHPGQPGPQTVQSVAVHLVSLYLVLEKGTSPDYAGRTLKRLVSKKGAFEWLEPPENMGPVTVADILNTEGAAAHLAAIDAWASSAWQAWSAHHAKVRDWSLFLEE